MDPGQYVFIIRHGEVELTYAHITHTCTGIFIMLYFVIIVNNRKTYYININSYCYSWI